MAEQLDKFAITQRIRIMRRLTRAHFLWEGAKNEAIRILGRREFEEMMFGIQSEED